MNQLTYIGGPTALLELDGLRLFTDPTFDSADSEYKTSVYTLNKSEGPAISPDVLGRVNAVLLSHDHHFDNLDRAGRQFLSQADHVLTTMAGAERLGGNAVGLAPWQTFDLPAADKRTLRITATPARHGPVDGDRGPVIGFVLAFTDAPEAAIYISGDTVWYEGVEEVARRFKIQAAILFMGAARVREVSPAHLTMTAEEGVLAARLFSRAMIVPLHHAGWAHFSESCDDIQRAFKSAGLEKRLLWLQPGVPTAVEHA